MFRKFTPTTSRCQTRRSFILKGYDMNMNAFTCLFSYTLTIMLCTLMYTLAFTIDDLFMELVLSGVASGMVGIMFTLMYKILTGGDENESTT